MRRALASMVVAAFMSFPGAAVAQFDACVVLTRLWRTSDVAAGTSANLDRSPVCIDIHSDRWEWSAFAVDHTLDISAECADRHGTCRAYSLVRHIGVMEPLILSSTVTGHGAGHSAFEPTQHSVGTGLGELEVEFTVAAARGFTLDISLDASITGSFAPSSASASFSLVGPDVSIMREVAISRSDDAESVDVREKGVLVPGNYTLRLRARGQGWNIPVNQGIANAIASFTLELSPRSGPSNSRCPQDWNNDGVVDSRDFFAFLVDFFSGDADFNGDCRTDSGDFFEFIQRFYVICG